MIDTEMTAIATALTGIETATATRAAMARAIRGATVRVAMEVRGGRRTVRRHPTGAHGLNQGRAPKRPFAGICLARTKVVRNRVAPTREAYHKAKRALSRAARNPVARTRGRARTSRLAAKVASAAAAAGDVAAVAAGETVARVAKTSPDLNRVRTAQEVRAPVFLLPKLHLVKLRRRARLRHATLLHVRLHRPVKLRPRPPSRHSLRPRAAPVPTTSMWFGPLRRPTFSVRDRKKDDRESGQRRVTAPASRQQRR